MPSRTLKIVRRSGQVLLYLQQGLESEDVIKAELLEIVFAHNDALLPNGDIRPELGRGDEMKRVRDRGPNLGAVSMEGGGERLEAMVMAPEKLPAVRAALESRGYVLVEG